MRLLAEAAERDLFFAINFNHRYAEPVQRAKAAIDAGELGELVFATWRFGGEANHGTSRHANLIETQCHGFDMLEHLVGPIASVMAQATDKTYGDWSTLAIALEFSNGAVGTMLGSYDSSYAYPDSQRVEVNGTAGRLVIHDTVRELTISRAGDESSRGGGPATSTTRPATSPEPSTGTWRRCSPPSGPARSRRCTPAPADARSPSRTP